MINVLIIKQNKFSRKSIALLILRTIRFYISLFSNPPYMAKKQLKKAAKKVVKKRITKNAVKKKTAKVVPVSSKAKASKKVKKVTKVVKKTAKKTVKKIAKKITKKTVIKKIPKTKVAKQSNERPSDIIRRKIGASLPRQFENPYLGKIDYKENIFRSRIDNGISINGIGFEKEMKLRSEGVTTMDQFIALGEEGIARILGVNLHYAESFLIKAKAIKDKKAYQIKPLSSIDSNCIMLDIETDYFEGKYANKTAWMVGMFDRPTNQLVQYVAHNPNEVNDIIAKTYDFLDSFSNRKIIVYSGSNFDSTILKHRFEYYNRAHHHLDFKDILIEMRNCLAFPFKSMDLSNVAEHYNYKFKHPHIDGREVGMAWETHKTDMKKHRSFQKYLEYNEDDVRSLNTVFENIYINNNYHKL